MVRSTGNASKHLILTRRALARCAGWAGTLCLLTWLVSTGPLAPSILAQEAPKPPKASDDSKSTAASEAKARVLVAAAVKALGGAESCRQCLDATLVCEVNTVASRPGLKVSGSVRVWTRADGSRRVERDLAGRTHVVGTSGTSFWQLSPDGKVSDLDVVHRDALRMDHLLQTLLLDYSVLGYSLAVPSSDGSSDGPLAPRSVTFTRNGAQPDKPRPQDRVTFRFDEESHLPAEITYLASDPWGGKPFPLTVLYGDYRKVDGAHVAHRVSQQREGKTLHKIAVTQIKIGVTHPDSLFVKPASQ